jgi:hypothetical protein
MKNLTLRLEDDDHKLLLTMAAAEDLPLTTFIRRVMKQYARDNGYLAAKHTLNNPAAQSPTATPPAAPMRNDVLTREALLRRVDDGQQLREVADSVGILVSELQARLAQAKTARADGSLQRELDIQAFMRDNPKPDDGNAYRLRSVPTLDNTGRVFSWVRDNPDYDMPAPRDTAQATAPHAHSDDPEENAARVRAKLLAMGFNL